ncbi:hypothetical protein INT46_007721 [Mucor plumbeus]|uniref:Transmembrane protein n=1 Tax=Mucor plumbeus TaxID=97098 RepID=A0A8H7QUD9_9FUNG|nr:hypothetical protein INT46_007721 [Mucor plumbeus]
MSSLQDTINECIKSCSAAGSTVSVDKCTELCDKAAKCTDVQCAKDVLHETIDAALSGASTSTINIGLTFLFVMFTIYLINFRNNH